MKHGSLLLLACALILSAWPTNASAKGYTLDDLKKLDIICLVPAWLPEGYTVKKVNIDYSDREGLHDSKSKSYPGYEIEYGNGKKGRFTIECARWGIGDRNLDQDDRAEEATLHTKRFGPVYIIYFPPGKAGVKDRIVSNWIEDETMVAEKKSYKGDNFLPQKGRHHGVSGFHMTLAEFEKIVQSLHPIRD